MMRSHPAHPPTRRRARLTVALVVAAIVAGSLVDATPATRATPAAAAPGIDHSKGLPGFCPDEVGVTVVVDFQQLGGTTIVRCYPSGSPGTGLDALKGAGFEIEGVRRWGEAFICRIENRPSAVESIPIEGNGGYQEACIDTPPAAGYWSYWHAGNNCAWEYSQWGVKNRDFIPGGFEGWSFSLNATADTNPDPRIAAVRPGTDPDEPCTAPDEPAPTTNDPNERQPSRDDSSGGGGGGGGDGGGSGDGGSSGGDGSGGGGSGDGEGEGDGGTADDDGLPAPAPRPRTTSPSDEAPDDPADNVSFTGGEDLPAVEELLDEQSNASPWAPWAAAGVMVVLLGGIGLTVRRRRRRREA